MAGHEYSDYYYYYYFAVRFSRWMRQEVTLNSHHFNFLRIFLPQLFPCRHKCERICYTGITSYYSLVMQLKDLTLTFVEMQIYSFKYSTSEPKLIIL